MSTLTNAKTMINALRNAGIEIPKEVDDASKRSKFLVNPPNTVEAERKLTDAKTQAEFDKATADLALAIAVSETVRSHKLEDAIKKARERAYTDALYPIAPDLLDEVITRFNAVTEPFEESVSRIPDLSGMGPLDMTPDISRALLDAKEAVKPLRSLWTAYNAILTFLGLPEEYGRNGPSASRIVARLGTGFERIDEDNDELWAATNLVYRYSNSADDVQLGALAPFVGIVRAGGRLNLVTPSEAEARVVEVPDSKEQRIYPMF
jgi:hypothetical protein